MLATQEPGDRLKILFAPLVAALVKIPDSNRYTGMVLIPADTGHPEVAFALFGLLRFPHVVQQIDKIVGNQIGIHQHIFRTHRVRGNACHGQ